MNPTLPSATPTLPPYAAGVARPPESAPQTAERGRPAAFATPTPPAANVPAIAGAASIAAPATACSGPAQAAFAQRAACAAQALSLGPATRSRPIAPRASKSRPAFAAVCADIAAQAQADALIDAEDALAELQSRLRDLRAMRPATAALLFGSDAAWRGALARVGVAAGRQTGAVELLRSACRATPDFALHEIARPLATGTRVQWTGD